MWSATRIAVSAANAAVKVCEKREGEGDEVTETCLIFAVLRGKYQIFY